MTRSTTRKKKHSTSSEHSEGNGAVAAPSVERKPETAQATQAAKPPKWQTYVLLHVIIALYSLAGVCSKMAAGESFLSFAFFAWYAGVLIILFVYAIAWQQVLKRLTLTSAFANKGATLIWGMLWGALIFAEHISLWMIIGAAVAFVGIILVVSSDE